MSDRRKSIYPEGARRKSIWQDRKPSIDAMEGMANYMGRRRASIIPGRRMSIFSNTDSFPGRPGMSAEKNRMNIKYENTYKIEPDDKFPIYKAKQIAKDLLESHLDEKEYNKEECTRNSKTLSDVIKHQVKALGHPRYKIVTIVAIGQNQESTPSLSFTSRCIWNDKHDNYAEASFKSKQLYAVALVYAIYAD